MPGANAKAYEAGWAGAIMKTAFDNVPIHIPAEYMFSFSPSTYANAITYRGIRWSASAAKSNNSSSAGRIA